MLKLITLLLLLAINSCRAPEKSVQKTPAVIESPTQAALRKDKKFQHLVDEINHPDAR